MPEVKLVGITKEFGNVTAVSDFDLRVKDGEYVTILGPSGCGKTTIVKMVAGIFEPSRGDVYIDGHRVNDVPTDERDLGYVFQNIALFPHMNVSDNVTYGPRVKGWERKRIEEMEDKMARLVRMEDRRKFFPRELSGGAQQKTSLGRALASGAKLLLLDEPLSALDAGVRTELRRELRRLVKDLGLTAIHVTHDQEEAMSISDRIVLMRNGRIVETNTPRALYHRPGTVFTANFIGEMNFIECVVRRKRERKVDVVTKSNENLRVPAEGFSAGDPIIVAIRPESVLLEGGKTRKGLVGKVKNRVFMGSYTRYQIGLVSGETVLSDVPLTLDKKVNIGDEIMIDFKKGNVLTYKRPREGMTEALKLE